MESPAGPHSASPAELQAAARGRARAGCPSCSGASRPASGSSRLEPGAERVTVGRGAEVDVRARRRRAGLAPARRDRADRRRVDGRRRRPLAQRLVSQRRAGQRPAAARATATSCASATTIVVFRAPAPRRARRPSPPPTAPRCRQLTETQRQDPDRALPARFATAAATRRRRPTSRSPTRSSSRVDAVKGHLRVAVREVRGRRPAAEPEAGAAGRAGAAKRRDLGPRPLRMSEPSAPREAARGPAIGAEFAGHRIEAVIGEGGMGVVYRAPQPRPRPDRARSRCSRPRCRPTRASASASGASRGSRRRSSTRT